MKIVQLGFIVIGTLLIVSPITMRPNTNVIINIAVILGGLFFFLLAYFVKINDEIYNEK